MEKSDQPDITDCPVALVMVVERGTTSAVRFNPPSTAIVVEMML